MENWINSETPEGGNIAFQKERLKRLRMFYAYLVGMKGMMVAVGDLAEGCVTKGLTNKTARFHGKYEGLVESVLHKIRALEAYLDGR